MKRSEVILLTMMVGTVAALNVERRPDTVRNVYNSREDCLHDYSDTQCSQTTGGSGYNSGRWVGPEYRDDGNTRKSQHASGRETVRRGGFGSSGRGVSS